MPNQIYSTGIIFKKTAKGPINKGFGAKTTFISSFIKTTYLSGLQSVFSCL